MVIKLPNNFKIRQNSVSIIKEMQMKFNGSYNICLKDQEKFHKGTT